MSSVVAGATVLVHDGEKAPDPAFVLEVTPGKSGARDTVKVQVFGSQGRFLEGIELFDSADQVAELRANDSPNPGGTGKISDQAPGTFAVIVAAPAPATSGKGLSKDQVSAIVRDELAAAAKATDPAAPVV